MASNDMYVILDTNIIIKDYYFQSKKFEAFFEYLKKTPHKLILPDIVIDELIVNYCREIRDIASSYDDLNKTSAKYAKVNLPALPYNEKECEQKYREFIVNFCKSNPIIRVTYQEEHYKKIVDRAIHRKAPFMADKRDYGLKDAILWETVMDSCRKDYEAIAFVSSNTTQFANSTKDELAEQLRHEVDKNGTRLIYFPSLESFLERYGEKLRNISHDAVQKALVLKAVDMINDGSFSELTLKEIFEYEIISPVQRIDISRVELKNFFVSSMDKKYYYVEAVGRAYADVIYWNPELEEKWPTEMYTTFKSALKYDRQNKILSAEAIKLDKVELPF